MRIQRLTTVFFLSGFIAASAAAFEIKPGEWEMEVGGVGGGAAQKQKICVSPDQAKSSYLPPKMKDCKTNFSEEKAGVVSYEMNCDTQGMKMETRGTVRKIGDNEVQTDATTTMIHSGQKPSQAMKTESKVSVKKLNDNEIVTNTTTNIAGLGSKQITIRQKYIGPNCSKDAKPMEGSAPGK
ncbi:MAG: DUF3617 domain-containing protein [Betaproteobacteria bacterium]|nr:DUF3617 domain-containing protein [Betaproteobacteria bacterium]